MNRRIAQTLLAVGFLCAALLLSPALRGWAQRVRTAYRAGETEGDVQRRNQGAFARALGELRATASDMMFVKMNRYVHAGVGYDTSLNVSAMESNTDLGDAGAPTIIRSAGDDFRGFLGDLERQVKPYRDQQLAHIHTTKGELTPWFRVMTLANPQFVRGYRLGGLTIADEGMWEEAQAFMEEGLRNNQDNPQLFLLHMTLASFHRRGRNNADYPWGEKWLNNSLHHALEGYRLGKPFRPPGWTDPEEGQSIKPFKGMVWTVSIEEDFQMGAHLVPLLLRERSFRDNNPDDLREALQYAREIARLLPNYLPMQNLAKALEKQVEETLDK